MAVRKKKTVSKKKRAVPRASVKAVKSVRKLAKKSEKSVKSLAKKSARKVKAVEEKSEKSVKSLAKKSARTDANLKSEMEKLKSELANLKKKRKANRRHLNEYNLFIRKQILAGRTFKQAVALWNKFKKLQGKRKPSAYNSFMASQLKTGKTFKQAVALWKKIKSGNLGKTRTIVKTKTIVRRGKPIVKTIVRRAKPIIKTRTIVRRGKPIVKTIVRRAKPIIKTRTIVRRAKPITKIRRVVVKAKPVVRTRIVKSTADLTALQTVLERAFNSKKTEETKITSVQKGELGLPAEELAYRMVTLYFEELARTGFKRSLTLDELVTVYVHSLQRVTQRIGKPLVTLVTEEEMSYKLVKLYFTEMARFGVRRTMSFDELVDAYFFVLARIYPKAVETKIIVSVPETKITETTVKTTETKTQ